MGSGRASLVCTGCMGILDHALGMGGHRSADPWKKSVEIWIRVGWQEMTVSEANFDGSNINITEVFFQWFLDPKAFAKLIFLY